MTFPCEYCQRPVDGAERFLRLGVMPCCLECRFVPLVSALRVVAGIVLLILLCAVAWSLL
jgi:hypothetical protein